MQKFRYKDCPEDKTVYRWIQDNMTDLGASAPIFDPYIQIPELEYDTERVAHEVLDLVQRVPVTHWRSQPPHALFGMSLQYDPYAPPVDTYCGSFGHPRYQEFSKADYYAQPASDLLKGLAPRGDYLDIMAFRKFIPELDDMSELKRVFAGFKRPVCRATLRIVDGNMVTDSATNTGGFHVDTDPRLATRINLIVQTNPNFCHQYEGHDPIYFPNGHNVVNTDLMHRVYSHGPMDFHRVHIVFDVLPWLDYDQLDDAWTPTENWNTKHPYDMIRDGDFYSARN
jgi:hypothetical protein